MFEFYIDGTKYADPINWKDFTETIEYVDSQYTVVFKYDQKLNFNGSAFEYLYRKKLLEGFCYEAEILIKQKCAPNELFKTIFTGRLFLSDCNFLLGRCVVECAIIDNNYTSLVFNNKNIKVFMEIPAKTKNGFPISFHDALGHGTLNKAWSWFNPNGGGTAGGGVLCIHVYDAFKFIINWITDGKVDFKSDLMDYSLPIISEMDKIKYLTIISGQELRISSGGLLFDKQYLHVSFDELFKNVNKYYPLSISVEYTGTGKPILRLEEFDFLRQSTNSIQINNIREIEEHVNVEFLYSRISIGGPSAEYNSSIHSYPPTKQLTHAQEQYFLTGQCNIDKEKDLKSDFICDTNIIEELVHSNPSNQNYDSDIFFMEVDTVSSVLVSARATANYDDPSKYHYNDNLLNKYTMYRNPVANDVEINTGVGIDLENTSDGPSTGTLGTQSNVGGGSMPAEQFSSFGNVAYTIDNVAVFDGLNYTALIAGSYTFEINQSMRCLTNTNRAFYIHQEVRRYNSGAVLQETLYRDFGPFTATGFYPMSVIPQSFNMAVGDYVTEYIRYSSQPIDFTIASSCEVRFGTAPTFASLFKTDSTPNSAGIVSNSTPLSYNANILNFEYPLDQSNYDLLKADPKKSILFNMGDPITRKGWIRKAIRTLSTGETKWELISNITNTQ